DLPGAESREDLEFLYSWVASARRSRARRRASELQERQRALYRRWCELEGLESARRLVREEMAEGDVELERCGADQVNLEDQVGELYVHLVEQHKALAKARKASPRVKARLVGGMVERLVCHFEHFEAGTQRRSRLVRVEVLPLVGEPVTLCSEGPP